MCLCLLLEEFHVRFFYTSTGSDLEYFCKYGAESRSINFTNSDEIIGEKLVLGELELRDSTKGVISKKAYPKHLSAEIAKEVVEKSLPETPLS